MENKYINVNKEEYNNMKRLNVELKNENIYKILEELKKEKIKLEEGTQIVITDENEKKVIMKKGEYLHLFLPYKTLEKQKSESKEDYYYVDKHVENRIGKDKVEIDLDFYKMLKNKQKEIQKEKIKIDFKKFVTSKKFVGVSIAAVLTGATIIGLPIVSYYDAKRTMYEDAEKDGVFDGYQVSDEDGSIIKVEEGKQCENINENDAVRIFGQRLQEYNYTDAEAVVILEQKLGEKESAILNAYPDITEEDKKEAIKEYKEAKRENKNGRKN